mmetsp:Transcript_6825/g.9748  ORF Transcript_6825/g.9748 Transcript_6825/m.9748 type:complete len:554 (-) Transcript_6825:187-1848(-)
MGLLVELTLDFVDHLHGSGTDRLHSQGSESEGDHTTNNQEGESKGLQHIYSINEDSVVRCVTDTGDESSEKSERHKDSGSNCETLSDSSSGVTSSVKSIGLFTDEGFKFSHLGNTSGIIADGSIDINRQTSSKVRKETDGRKGNTIKASNGEGFIYNGGKDKDGDDSRFVTKSNTVNHVGRSTSLTGVSNLTHGCVGVRCVVLSDETNDKTSHGTHANTEESFPWVKSVKRVTNASLEYEFTRKVKIGSKVNRGEHKNSSTDKLDLEGGFDVLLCPDRGNVGCDEGANQANKHTNSGNDDGKDHSIPACTGSNGGTKNESGTGGLSKTSEKIRSHTGNISNIVSNVISNGGRVTRVILRDSVDNLSDKIGSNISSLGVDTSTDTSKHGNDGSSKSITSDALVKVDPIRRIWVMNAEGKHSEVQHKDSKTTKSESHDGSCTEGSVEACSPSWFLCRNGGTNIRVNGYLHSKVSTCHRCSSTEKEREGSQKTTGNIHSGSPSDKSEDNTGKDDDEPEADVVFSTKETFCSFVNGFVNFDETKSCCIINSTTSKTG